MRDSRALTVDLETVNRNGDLCPAVTHFPQSTSLMLGPSIEDLFHQRLITSTPPLNHPPGTLHTFPVFSFTVWSVG